MMKPSTLVMAGLMLMPLACSEEPEPPLVVDEVDVELGDPDPLDLGTSAGRGRRRMTIDQLDASIERVTGGITWDFERNAQTLGVPDYIGSTSEDTAITLLFSKFLDDAARAVCTELMAREVDAEERVFVVEGELDTVSGPTISANLSYQLLRFHGRSVAEDSPELEPWLNLFSTVSTEVRTTNEAGEDVPDVATGWSAVCVALLTHPDFYTY